MAHLWVETGKDGWAVAPLAGDAFVLVPQADRPIRIRRPTVPPSSESDAADGRPRQAVANDGAALVRSACGDKEHWVLLSAPISQAVAVNGMPVVLGMRVLHDRDEIRVPRAPRMFFSTEQIARVEPYVAGGRRGKCPRCDSEIVEGSPSVRCPQCGVAHHQDPASEMGCWTYARTCASCPQPTGLDLGYTWTPEEL